MTFVSAAAVLPLVAVALGPQPRPLPRLLIADRTSDRIWILVDANDNGTFDAVETREWFDWQNADGTTPPGTPATIAVRRDGLTAVGDSDSLVRGVLLLRDRTENGNALDAGESVLAAGPDNLSGVGLGFPGGAAFDAGGYLYVANASNAFGLDAIYRLRDLDGDGTFQGVGEIAEFVGAPAFGSSSGGSFNPQEIIFIGDVGYMRNSGANFHGVYRFRDLDANGRADDPGEFGPFWDMSAQNQSGVLPTTGLVIEPDLARPGAMYVTLNVGGEDQIVRLADLTGDGTAHQPGEAVVVYANGDSGFGISDLASLPDGRLLVSDTSSDQVFVLEDLDGDGLFTGEGESRIVYEGSPAGVDVRQIAVIPCPGDWNLDLVVNSADISAFLAGWLDAVTGQNLAADINADGATNSADISAFLSTWLIGVQGGC